MRRGLSVGGCQHIYFRFLELIRPDAARLERGQVSALSKW